MNGLKIFEVFGSVGLDDKASEGLDKLDKKASGFDEKMKNLGEGMSKIGSSLTKNVTLPLIGLGTAAVVTVSGFDDSMSRVQAISGATGDELNKLREMAKQLGADTRFSAAQAADGMTYLAMAGWKTNDIMSAMPGLLALASAGGLELADSADITSNIMSAFNIEASKSVQVADVLAKGASMANTDVTLLGESMKYAGSAANVAGMDLQQTVAVLDALANAGIKGGMAGTTFNAMLRDLKAASDNGTISIGNQTIAIYDQQGKMRDLTSIMGDLEKAFGGMTDAQRDAYMSAIFGEQALKGANIVLTTGTEKVRELERALYDSSGAALEMSAIMEDNIGGSFRELKSAAEGVAIEFGEVIAPVIIDFIQDTLRPLLNYFSALPSEVKENVLKFSLLAAAIGPVLSYGGKLVTSIGSITKGLKTLSGGIGNLVAAAFPNMGYGLAALSSQIGSIAAATGPIALLVAAIGGLGFAIYKLTEENRKPLTDFQEMITESFEAAKVSGIELAEEMNKEIVENYTNLKNEVEEQLRNMSKEGITITEEMKDSMLEKITNLKDEHIAIIEDERKAALEVLEERNKDHEFLNSEHYSKEKQALNEYYDEQIKKTETNTDNINKIVLEKLQEQGYITEEQLDVILGIVENFGKDEEIMERERHTRGILLQEEMNKTKQLNEKEAKSELKRIMEDALNEELRIANENYETKIADLVAYQNRTGAYTDEQFRNELRKLERENEDERIKINEHMNNIYKDNEKHFHELRLMYDTHTGEIRKRQIEDMTEEEYWESFRMNSRVYRARKHYKSMEDDFNKHGDQLTKDAEKAGKELNKGFEKGIKEDSYKPENAAKGLFQSVSDWFTKVFQIQSPSKVSMEWGRNITEGLVQGITDDAELKGLDLALDKTVNRVVEIETNSTNREETFIFNGDIIVPVEKLREFKDVIDFFKNMGKERIARGVI